MKNNPIGVFDSGVGGLTVFSKLIKLLPNEKYIYYGDTKNLPYGTKTKDELIEIARNIFDYFESKNVKAVVMACNTTSALTYETLKDNYNYEIYPIIQTAAKHIAESPVESIGVLSTPATASSHAYKNEINKYNQNIQVTEIGCPGWVQIVEGKNENKPESIIAVGKFLTELLEKNVDKIILGCTHYPYLTKILTKFAPQDLFIDPSECFVEYIISDLSKKGLLTNEPPQEPEFIVSSEAKNFKKAAELFYELKDLPKVVSL